MVVNELDTLREASSGCDAIAFADLSTRMILVTDTQSNLPREALDALCLQASSVLGVSGKIALGAHPSRVALLAEKSTVRLFLRAANEPDDVLCCVCTPNIDIDKLVEDATACLNRISGG
jgi:hypothetical protein